jgi:hypothetical protein
VSTYKARPGSNRINVRSSTPSTVVLNVNPGVINNKLPSGDRSSREIDPVAGTCLRGWKNKIFSGCGDRCGDGGKISRVAGIVTGFGKNSSVMQGSALSRRHYPS